MKLRSHMALFPTPDTLSLSSVGIDLSDRSLRFAELLRVGTQFELGKHGTVAILPGIIESGKIKDRSKLIETLKAFKTEYGFQFVRVSLPEEVAYRFSLTIPTVAPHEVRNAIELQLEEHIPLAAIDTTFDYTLLEEKAGLSTYLVGAIPSLIAEEYLSIFMDAGLMPLSFEVEADALRRSVIPAVSDRTFMVVDFGQTRTGISIISNGHVFFTSTLDVCGEALTKIIEKNFNVSFDEAETMKRTYGLRRVTNGSTPDLFPVLLNTVSILRDELNKFYIYWHTEESLRPKIDSIIFCGGNANMVGLTSYVAASMRVRVAIADVWTNIPFKHGSIPDISFDDSLSYATALGLALANHYND